MDDAGDGRRGARATVSQGLSEVLAARYPIPRQQGRDLGGSLNLNLLARRGDEHPRRLASGRGRLPDCPVAVAPLCVYTPRTPFGTCADSIVCPDQFS